jgi:multidrug efflux system outer membrane protein
MSSPGVGFPLLPSQARCVAVGLALVLLGGCAQLGTARNDGRTSAVPIPAAWSQASETNKAASSTNELQSWWRRLDDPLLDQLIAAAMTAAPDLRTAQTKLRQARASRDLAVGNLYPGIGVSASANRSKTGTAEARTQYAAGFDASWEPSIFGGKRDAVSGAQADVAASEATLAAAQVSLAAEVALEYVTLRAYQQRLAIARANTASQTGTLQITDWRQQAGLTTMLNVEQARTNLDQSRAAIPGLETGRAQAEHRLAVLTGQVPGALADRLREAKSLPRAPDGVAVGIPADTIRQRPDVRAAELTLRAEVARSAEQEAALYPSLTLSGSWGWNAFSSAALGGSDTLVRSLAGSLAATLFDGGRIRARIAVQDAVQERALVAYESSILTALEDVENALAAYAAGRTRLDGHGCASVAELRPAARCRSKTEMDAPKRAGKRAVANLRQRPRARRASEPRRGHAADRRDQHRQGASSARRSTAWC